MTNTPSSADGVAELPMLRWVDNKTISLFDLKTENSLLEIP